MNDKERIAQEEVPMVEQYKVESSLVHASKTRRAAVIISILATVCILASIIGNVVIVEIFTSRYNSRTKDWIELAKALAGKTAVTEVDNAYTEKMEQLSLPRNCGGIRPQRKRQEDPDPKILRQKDDQPGGGGI